tara:strand:- start:3639 stop:4046 length:408 start_codon:yes stop_codon:yes gene_type:complete
MKRNLIITALLCFAISVIVGCAPASYHKKEVQDDSGDRISVGTVQKEIKKGMSGAEVAAALGSPNIVSTDEQGREVWIYDKISKDTVFSASDAGLRFFTSGVAGAQSTSQRTLTVIIKFDKSNKVRDFAYHRSSF